MSNDLISRSAAIEEFYSRVGGDLSISDIKYIETVLNGVLTAFHDRNDGWIPCGKELPGEWYVDPYLDPEDIEWPEYNVTIQDASETTTLHYNFQERTWFDDNGNFYEVVAWRPMPQTYRPIHKSV